MGVYGSGGSMGGRSMGVYGSGGSMGGGSMGGLWVRGVHGVILGGGALTPLFYRTADGSEFLLQAKDEVGAVGGL